MEDSQCAVSVLMKGKRLAGIDMDMDAVLSSLIEENKVLRARIKRLLQSAEENLTQTLDGSLLKVLADNALEVPEVVKVFETALTLLLEGMPFGLSYWDEKLSCTYTKFSLLSSGICNYFFCCLLQSLRRGSE